MAPEQMELQQLAEAWHKAYRELESQRQSLSRLKTDVENRETEVNKLAKVLETKVGNNLPRKLVLVDKDMAEFVLIEYLTSAHGNYVGISLIRTE